VRLARLLRWGVQQLPERAAYALGLAIAWAIDLLIPRRPIRQNLRLMTGRDLHWGELRAFEKAYARHLGLFVVEWLRQPLITLDHFEPEGLEHARSLLEERGVIFVTSHAGNWELTSHAAGLMGMKLTVTAKESGQADLDGFTKDIREFSGSTFLDSRGTLWTCKKKLDRGESVGLDVDQQARQNNVFVPFFGIECACSATPASLQLQTKRPIAVISVHRTGPWRYRVRLLDVIPYQSSGRKRAAKQADTKRIIRRITRSFEQMIQEYPEQWLWSHRRFRRRPPGREGEPWPFARSPDDDVRLDLSRFADS
jgi:KDO2-lipid IV(A) lauroyltransferase